MATGDGRGAEALLAGEHDAVFEASSDVAGSDALLMEVVAIGSSGDVEDVAEDTADALLVGVVATGDFEAAADALVVAADDMEDTEAFLVRVVATGEVEDDRLRHDG